MKKDKRVSNAVIRRLPRYYRNLEELNRNGVVRISSAALSDSMGITASQIRQDLSCFGEFGLQGYGYKVASLLSEIGEILGINKGHKAILLGVGNLGRALMANFHFDRCGFTLEAAFDIDSAVVGGKVAGVSVYPVDDLEKYLSQHSADVAVLTVPGHTAQDITNRLVRAGMPGIWNFTNTELTTSDETVVENVHFADSMLTLSYMIMKG